MMLVLQRVGSRSVQATNRSMHWCYERTTMTQNLEVSNQLHQATAVLHRTSFYSLNIPVPLSEESWSQDSSSIDSNFRLTGRILFKEGFSWSLIYFILSSWSLMYFHITLKFHIKYCTLDDKLVAISCMAQRGLHGNSCHAVLSGPCNYTMHVDQTRF